MAPSLWVISSSRAGHWLAIQSCLFCYQPQLTRLFPCSRQPWSAYAVHLTTLSPPALLGDLLLVWLCHKATVSWGDSLHDQAMTWLYLWIFTSKWIKLVGHYIRYPVDVLLLPVSVLFGYFHGAIKVYAVMTLNVVSCIVFFLFHFASAGRSRRKLVEVLAGCGLPEPKPTPKRQPFPAPASFFLPPYDTPASQRFDHDSSFLQPHLSTVLPVRAIFPVPGSFLSLICLMSFPLASCTLICISPHFQDFPLTRDVHFYRQLGVAVMVPMIMTQSA